MLSKDTETKFKKYYNCFKGNRKKKLDKLLYEDDLWKRYTTTPASVKYHGSYLEGLIDHSVVVTQILVNILSKIAPKMYSNSTICLVGLFHDIGKVGNESHSYYIDTIDTKTGKNKYIYNSDMFSLPHSARSIKILTEAGIVLTEDEFQAILYHNGLYTKSGFEIKNKELALTIALHFSDMWASSVLQK